MLLPKDSWKQDIYDGEWSLLNDAQTELRDIGIEINFHTELDESISDCDALFLSSRCFALDDPNLAWADILSNLQSLNQNIFWFDMRDSAGTTQFEVLPFVKKYIKKQLYRDRNLYYTPPYGGRAYTDFYHRKFGVVDGDVYQMHPLERQDEHKLALGWNIGVCSRLKPSRLAGTLFAKVTRRLMSELNAANLYSPNVSNLQAVSATLPRPLDIMAVLGTSYRRETVSFHRKKLLEHLSPFSRYNGVVGGRLSQSEFNRHLRKSKLVISGFGWGEVCYREFEATWIGAAFAMPDMSGIETWPNIYESGKTYIPFAWDFTDLHEKIDSALSQPEHLRALTANAQQRLVSLRSVQGLENFAKKIRVLSD